MRRCTRCHIEKEDSEFNFKNKDKGLRQYHCNKCTRWYLRSHYNRNREYYLLKAKRRNHKIREISKRYVWEYLNKHSCIDCGEKDPTVLEFDHLSQYDKKGNVSHLIRYYSIKKIDLEIAKCEIRCANCHRRKTARENGWDKRIMPL